MATIDKVLKVLRRARQDSGGTVDWVCSELPSEDEAMVLEAVHQLEDAGHLYSVPVCDDMHFKCTTGGKGPGGTGKRSSETDIAMHIRLALEGSGQALGPD